MSSRASSTAFSKCSTGSSAPRAADVTLDCGVYSSAWLSVGATRFHGSERRQGYRSS
jgi:hypothetical protein